jgi:hypothetical protein
MLLRPSFGEVPVESFGIVVGPLGCVEVPDMLCSSSHFDPDFVARRSMKEAQLRTTRNGTRARGNAFALK